MHSPLLVIITGPPAAGKTTLAKELNRRFRLPIISLDVINEALFDSIGYEDESLAPQIENTAYNILFSLVKDLLSNDTPLIVESNFNPNKHSIKFAELQNEIPIKTIQILCDTKREIFIERFAARWDSGTRHPGHRDHTRIQGLKTAKIVELNPLKIESSFLRVNTTSRNSIDYPKIDTLISLGLAK